MLAQSNLVFALKQNTVGQSINVALMALSHRM